VIKIQSYIFKNKRFVFSWIRCIRPNTPFTRYNRFAATGCQPAVSCKRTCNRLSNGLSNRLDNRLSNDVRLHRFDNRLSNRFDNRLNVRIHDTAGCETGCQTGLTIGLTTVLNEQPLFVQPVVKPGCTTGLTTGCIHDTAFVKPVVKRVWQPVECLYTRYNRLSTTGCQQPGWQQVVSCKRGLTFVVTTCNGRYTTRAAGVSCSATRYTWPVSCRSGSSSVSRSSATWRYSFRWSDTCCVDHVERGWSCSSWLVWRCCSTASLCGRPSSSLFVAPTENTFTSARCADHTRDFMVASV